jgi:hypothetical protein
MGEPVDLDRIEAEARTEQERHDRYGTFAVADVLAMVTELRQARPALAEARRTVTVLAQTTGISILASSARQQLATLSELLGPPDG